MAGLRDIRTRIKSVKNTKKITYAMKLVSATKLRRAQEAVERSRAYTRELGKLLAGILAEQNGDEIAHPYLKSANQAKKIAVLIIGGNRGLCGGYNSNVNKAMDRFIAEHSSKNIDIFVIGKKPAEYLRRKGISYSKSYEDLQEDPATWPMNQIFAEIEDGYVQEEYSEIHLIYTKFKSAMSMAAVAEKLLPFDTASLLETAAVSESAAEGSAQISLYEPDINAVFDAILPRVFRSKILLASLDTRASEQGSRMTAMDAATKNASELIDGLNLRYNKLRQTGITNQILDIVGGAEGLKGK